MPYTLTIHPDGTHVAQYYEDGVISRDELTEAIGGTLYMESLAEDADAATSASAKNRGNANPFATAIAWAFGKTHTSYYGDVIITGCSDKRGAILGLREDQLDALTESVQALRRKRDAGLPLQLVGGELQLLDRFDTPNLEPEPAPEPEEPEKSNAGLIGVICLVVGLILGGGAAWLLTSGDDEETDVVIEESEEGAEEEAGVTAEELNELSEELAQRESDIEAYEEDMEDLDERESGLDSRDEDLDERESEVETRESNVSERESDAETREENLDEREEQLDEREEELDEREEELDNSGNDEPEAPEQPEQPQEGDTD